MKISSLNSCFGIKQFNNINAIRMKSVTHSAVPVDVFFFSLELSTTVIGTHATVASSLSFSFTVSRRSLLMPKRCSGSRRG